MNKQHGHDSRFARLRTRLSQALLREPSVVLLERDADPFAFPYDPGQGIDRRHEAHR